MRQYKTISDLQSRRRDDRQHRLLSEQLKLRDFRAMRENSCFVEEYIESLISFAENTWQQWPNYSAKVIVRKFRTQCERNPELPFVPK